MDRRICFFVVVLWHMMSWVSARNIHSLPFHAAHHQGQFLQSRKIPLVSNQGNAEKNEEGLSRLGSRPPQCEHKCRGCTPCSPIQVPTSSAHAHLAPQYANYEPEGWKCKCGSIFFNP